MAAGLKQQHHSTRGARKQTFIEWTVIAFMLALCVGLTGLQYRWTGEVANAEVTRLRAVVEDQVRNFVRDFDGELTRAYEALVPSAGEVLSKGPAAAYGERFRQWKSTSPRAAFRRIAIASPTNGTLKLFELDQKQVRFVPAEWPDSWATLHQSLEKMLGPRGAQGPRGGPFADPTGRLVEFPIFGGKRPRVESPELQWAIFELAMNNVTNKWLPQLVSSSFTLTGKLVSDILIRVAADPGVVLFSTTASPDPRDAATMLSFNPQFRLGSVLETKGEGRWVIEARNRPDALDALVTASRRRNLGLAALLNGLMLTAGIFLVRYTRRSRELAERQMQFVANVSHELRTPLTVIQGAGENLARGIAHDPQAVKDYAQLILQYSKQLRATVEQVLALATARRHLPFASRQPIVIGQILAEAVVATREETEEAECEVTLEFPPDLPTVRGDELALGRAFGNLISNAAKHGAAGKWIGITARALDGDRKMVEVQIADRGPGIPQGEQERIFTPFIRGAQAEERAVRGSGLGLSIVREIIEAHGGTISVQSTLGQGATFIVGLPADQPLP